LLLQLLTYFIYKGIQKPIEFEKQKDARYEATIEKLKDIEKLSWLIKISMAVLPGAGIHSLISLNMIQ
jgi:hypothetical protein